MALETKVLIAALANIVRKSSSTKEVYEALEEMASVEGLTLKPFGEEKKETKS